MVEGRVRQTARRRAGLAFGQRCECAPSQNGCPNKINNLSQDRSPKVCAHCSAAHLAQIICPSLYKRFQCVTPHAWRRSFVRPHAAGVRSPRSGWPVRRHAGLGSGRGNARGGPGGNARPATPVWAGGERCGGAHYGAPVRGSAIVATRGSLTDPDTPIRRPGPVEHTATQNRSGPRASGPGRGMPGNRIFKRELGLPGFPGIPRLPDRPAGPPGAQARGGNGVPAYRTRRQVCRLQITLSTQPATSIVSGPFGVRLPE